MNKRWIEDITNFIFMEDEIKKADAIFLPGCPYARQAEEAGKLYSEGLAKWIFPSGRFAFFRDRFIFGEGEEKKYGFAFETEADFFAEVLRKSGVPETGIFPEKEARFTKENAVFTRKLAEEKGVEIQSAILICRAFHARRAYMYYQMAFPEVEIMVHPVVTIGVTRENWFRSKEGMEVVMGELSKCGEQMKKEVSEFLRDLLEQEVGHGKGRYRFRD